MLQLCKMFDCCEGQQQENRKHTFFSPNLSSRIDRIYATNDVKATSARVLPNQFSDHDTLIAQFNYSYGSRPRVLEKQRYVLSGREFFERFRNQMAKLETNKKQSWPCRLVD